MDKETEKSLSESFEKMNETFDRIEKHFDEMSNIINENLNKELEKNIDPIKVMVIKDSWKNTVIERIMYFLLGGAIGLAIHYFKYL